MRFSALDSTRYVTVTCSKQLPVGFYLKISIASSFVSDVYEDKIFVIYGDKVSIIRAVGESSLSK